MTILNAWNLSLEEVQRLFGFQEQYSDSFSNYLSLEELEVFQGVKDAEITFLQHVRLFKYPLRII